MPMYLISVSQSDCRILFIFYSVYSKSVSNLSCFLFPGASRFVAKNKELLFKDTLIKLSLLQPSTINRITDGESTTSVLEPAPAITKVAMITGLPEEVNERELKTFLIQVVKTRKAKIGIGNVFVSRSSVYVKTTYKRGKVRGIYISTPLQVFVWLC